MRKMSIALLLMGFVFACSPPSTAKSAREGNVISREEIAASHQYNAYDVVSTLRPAFLHSHGPTTFDPNDSGLPKVYLNHMLFGDLQSLRTLDVAGIREIRYYNGTEASNRFGLGNVAGAIEVITDAQ